MDILELRLQAHDLATQRAFYAETLGLSLAGETETTVAFQAGRTRLVFEQAPPQARPAYHFAFNIPQNRFAEARRWLLARVPLLKQGNADEFFFQSWNAHAMYFADPAGNIVEFIARHNLANTSDRPFDSRGILRVSEIGLPAPEVGAMVDALEGGLGLTLWSGDREAFAAVGDERGLGIVVPLGRRWMPDDRVPAVANPVALTIAGDSAWQYTVPGLPYHFRVVATGAA